jgi:hypothetical protein
MATLRNKKNWWNPDKPKMITLAVRHFKNVQIDFRTIKVLYISFKFPLEMWKCWPIQVVKKPLTLKIPAPKTFPSYVKLHAHDRHQLYSGSLVNVHLLMTSHCKSETRCQSTFGRRYPLGPNLTKNLTYFLTKKQIYLHSSIVDKYFSTFFIKGYWLFIVFEVDL